MITITLSNNANEYFLKAIEAMIKSQPELNYTITKDEQVNDEVLIQNRLAFFKKQANAIHGSCDDDEYDKYRLTKYEQ